MARYAIGTLDRQATGAGQTASTAATTAATLVIVGNGMVGHRLCRQLVECGVTARYRVVVFGEEAVPAYDRVHLTDVFQGRTEGDLCLAPEGWYTEHGIELRLGDAVVSIDREARRVRSGSGAEVEFSELVLATGSAPYVPSIDGAGLSRVHVYRALSDLRAIRSVAATSRAAAVIGGGLLGLEAARALQQQGLRVTVIEAAASLMPAQLDQSAGVELERQVKKGGVEVLTSTITRRIVASNAQRTLIFATGEELTVDLVIIAAGVRPRSELAARCALARTPEGGVVVDDGLRTSDPHIYAIGECAAHRTHVYGLVAPGFEMADALAKRLAGGADTFRGSTPTVRLKMLDVDVVSAGEPLDRGVAVHYEREGVARLIRLHRGRIVGALGVGAWDGFTDVQEATIRQRRVWPWQAVRFARTGRLWHSDPESAVAAWGPASVICQCMNVTRGQIGAACAGAPITVDRIMMRTGASTLCGSCRPLLEQLAQPGSWERPPIARGLLAGSFAAIIAAVAIVAVAPVPFATSFETPFRIDALWRNGLYRQISGFTLLGLALVASLLAVRKRWPRLATLGSFRGWRLVHVLLGVLTLAALAVHTGLRLGNNLNFALMAIFCAVNLAGGLAGGLTAVEQRIGMAHWRRRRALLVTVHVLLMWPLPLLIAFHVMAVYYF